MHKFDHPLEQAFISNKNDTQKLKTASRTLVGPYFFIVFTVLCAHYAKDHLPKSNGREKAAKWTNVAAKQIT